MENKKVKLEKKYNKLVNYADQINKHNVLIEDWNLIDEQDFLFIRGLAIDNRTILAKITKTFIYCLYFIPAAALLWLGYSILNEYTNYKIITNVFKIMSDLVYLNIGIVISFCFILGFTENKLFALIISLSAQFIFVFFVSVATQTHSGYANIFYYKNLTYNFFFASIWKITFFKSSLYFTIATIIMALYFYKYFRALTFKGSFKFLNELNFLYLILISAFVVLTILYIMLWPIIGLGLIELMNAVATAPSGIDMFFFQFLITIAQPANGIDFLRESLMVGSAGGTFEGHYSRILAIYVKRAYEQVADNPVMPQVDFDYIYNLNWDLKTFKNLGTDHELLQGPYASLIAAWIDFATNTEDGIKLFATVGDRNIAIALYDYNLRCYTQWLETNDSSKLAKLYLEDLWAAGMSITKFTSSNFVGSMFVLPSMGLGILFSMKGREMKNTCALIIGASLVSILTGDGLLLSIIILICSPLLYLAVYVPVMGALGVAGLFTELRLISYSSTGLWDFLIGGVKPALDFGSTTIITFLVIGSAAAGTMLIITTLWFKFFYFNPLGYAGSKEYQMKHDIRQLIADFAGASNITKAIIKNDNLYLILNEEVNFAPKSKYFDHIEKFGDKIYAFAIKEKYKSTIGSFLSYVSISKNIIAMQTEDQTSFNELLANYKILVKKTREKKYYGISKNINFALL